MIHQTTQSIKHSRKSSSSRIFYHRISQTRVHDLAEGPEGPQGSRPRRAHCRPLPALSLSGATPSPPVPLMVVVLVALARLVLSFGSTSICPLSPSGYKYRICCGRCARIVRCKEVVDCV